MVSLSFFRRLGLVPFLTAVLVLGCGGGTKVKVEGQLMEGPVPQKVPEGQTLHLSFVGKNAQGAEVSYPADVHPDGSFEVNKAEGGVPPGKYSLKMSISTSRNGPGKFVQAKRCEQEVRGICDKGVRDHHRLESEVRDRYNHRGDQEGQLTRREWPRQRSTHPPRPPVLVSPGYGAATGGKRKP